MKALTHKQMLIITKEIALNPNSAFETFYKRNDDGSVTFLFDFFQLSIPGSPIVSVSDKELAEEMINAIEANVNGPMAEAAKEYRKIRKGWSTNFSQVTKENDAYWNKLKSDGVFPEFNDRMERSAWMNSPVGKHLIELSPFCIEQKQNNDELDEATRRAWPGWFARDCKCYTDYVEAIRKES